MLQAIPGLDGYFVDGGGRVWSRMRGHNRWTGAHLVKQWTDPHGYKHVTLRPYGQKRRRYTVHGLVSLAFLGPRTDGKVCEHVNGRPGDNRPENLRYVSQAENIASKHAHGTANVGERNHLSKLTNAQAKGILILCQEGEKSLRQIAREFGVNETTVGAIRSGRIRKHLHAEMPAEDDRPPITFTGTANEGELREIPRFPTYKADSGGNVWSFWDGPRNRWPVPNKLKPHVQRDGYLEVRIRKPERSLSQYTQVQVHRLIALAWLGERPSGYVVHHKDGDRQNNRVSNLEYVTVLANSRHRTEHGTQTRGGRSRLSEEDASAILRLIRDGELPQTEIAKRFGVGFAAVWAIKTGRTWKHLQR